jgi:small subunit ribosomal protein S8
MMNDPISDMLTRIRNGLHARHETVNIPASKMKIEIARILRAEGYIKNFKFIQDNKQGIIKVMLKYDDDQNPIIIEMKRVSKPGRRVYAKVDDIPVVKKGLGVAILSTSKGVVTDKKARKEKVGGEVLCTVW